MLFIDKLEYSHTLVGSRKLLATKSDALIGAIVSPFIRVEPLMLPHSRSAGFVDRMCAREK